MMDKLLKDILWRQFGATIDMLGNALDACPEETWNAPMWNDPAMPAEFSSFWYVAYHTLFWLDLYLSGVVEGFTPPVPFDLNELDSDGVLPERRFNQSELKSYLVHCRKKCREKIELLTDEKAHHVCMFTWSKGGISFIELLLDNMRHVQEHGAQLSTYLGQQAGISTGWVSFAKDDDPAN